MYYSKSVEQTRRKYDSLKNKLNTIYDDRLDGRITPQRFDELASSIEREQQNLNDKLKGLTKDNKSFQVTASYLLDLAQRANELFKCSNYDLRQELLSYMLSNVELNDKSLSYILNDPFRKVIEQNRNARREPKSDLWQGKRGSGSNGAQSLLEDFDLCACTIKRLLGSRADITAIWSYEAEAESLKSLD